MRDWPICLTESETLAKMQAGKSLARFGDGELAIALGMGNSTHKPNKKLADEYVHILRSPSAMCLPAIPTMDPKSPKYDAWAQRKGTFSRVLDMGRVYGSALVGQISSCPWIDTDEHVNGFREVWKGKRAVGVSSGKPKHDLNGSDTSLQRVLSWDASEVILISCPAEEAYSEIDSIESACVKIRPDIVVACAGPMATALANRLAGRGIQCIDLGRGLGLILRHKYQS